MGVCSVQQLILSNMHLLYLDDTCISYCSLELNRYHVKFTVHCITHHIKIATCLKCTGQNYVNGVQV
jgi:hypothetical protein